MPFIKLQFRPGLNRDTTNYSSEGGWWDCNKIRFRSGYPQKIGGWVKNTPNTFLGVCRQMFGWITSYTDNFLALGTNSRVYIEAGGNFYDITPLRQTFTTTDTDNAIETTLDSTTVIVNLIAHGANNGDAVIISGVTGNVGGIPDAEINAEHIVSVIDVNTFVFEVTTPATSTVAAGGGTAIVMEFLIEPGNRSLTAGYGWGTGTWGRGSWGLGSTEPVYLPQRDWWFDNFDNDLVMNIRNGPIYYWQRGTIIDPSIALATRAVLLTDLVSALGDPAYDPDAVPAEVMQVLVSQNDKHLLAFGCVPYGSTSVDDFDALLIRWASQDDPYQWTPTPTNSAGFIRVSRGSQIIRALPTRQEILVWTNSHLYSLQFTGNTDVFSLQELADNISIMGPRTCAVANNMVFWMGQEKFYMYSGRVETLPCTIRNYIFQDINNAQADQIICGTNEGWNEVWWFYPSANSNWNNRYVVFNHYEKVWYYGTMERTAWLDSALRPYPQAVTTEENSPTGNLYDHEKGVNADELPMEAYIQSNDVDVSDGEQFMLTRRMIPDIDFSGSTAQQPEVTMQIRPRNFPGSNYFPNESQEQDRVVQTTVNNYTDQIFIRARARQMALKIMSEDLGVQWQLGSPRVDVRTDGKR